jgi:DNA-binding CsgD family transcriptional regulator/PAS domain-containing protein
MEEAQFSLVLDAVYDAATSCERWPVALERLGQAFGSNYVGLIDRNWRTREGRAIAVGVDLASQREYFEVWSTHDTLRQWTPAYRPGAIETDRDIMARSDLLRSDYYNGFMKPRDMHAVLRMTLAVRNESLKIISLSRPFSLGDFETAEVELCRRFMPHLQRAARVAQHVEELKSMLTAFSDALEQSARGVLLLGRTGRVLFANRAARAMAETADSFVLRRERIEVLSSRDDAALQRLIAGATGRIDRADAARGGVMRLARKSGKPDFAVAAAPLAGETPWTELGPAAFILITDPDATLTLPESMLRQLFGLSAAEARVAKRLMMGDSPEQVAAILGIKISTARWHLASLYRKTGTSRQTQLVRLLLSLPAV